jgi:hypothetical protein
MKANLTASRPISSEMTPTLPFDYELCANSKEIACIEGQYKQNKTMSSDASDDMV